MKTCANNLEETLKISLNRASLSLVFVLFLFNLYFFMNEVVNTTNSTYRLFVDQVESVSKANVNSGDLLSLQRQLESLSLPLARLYSLRLNVTRESDGKHLVDISSPEFGQDSWFVKKSSSVQKIEPFGNLIVETEFDHSKLVISSAFKALASYFFLIVAIAISRKYQINQNSTTLVPIDRLIEWLKSLNVDTVIRSENVITPPQLGFQQVYNQIDELTKKMSAACANQKIAKLAAQVAHDIRSPLCALRAAYESQPDQESSDLIKRAIDRINLIANDLLSCHQIESLNSQVSDLLPRKTNIVDALSSVVKEKQLEYAYRKNIAINFYKEDMTSTESATFHTTLCVSKLQRVISNLINNSVNAINDSGTITVKLNRRKKSFDILVADTGIGIDPHQLHLLNTGEAQSTGSSYGLGINYSREVIESIGGKMAIRSTVNGGTRVELKIPTEFLPISKIANYHFGATCPVVLHHTY